MHYLAAPLTSEEAEAYEETPGCEVLTDVCTEFCGLWVEDGTPTTAV